MASMKMAAVLLIVALAICDANEIHRFKREDTTTTEAPKPTTSAPSTPTTPAATTKEPTSPSGPTTEAASTTKAETTPTAPTGPTTPAGTTASGETTGTAGTGSTVGPTTAAPPTPCPECPKFHGWSFFGGIILGVAIVIIGYYILLYINRRRYGYP